MIGGLVRWFASLARRSSALGDRGEDVAARWLVGRGYRVLRRNLRVGRDEADLVMLDPDGRTIVVVEVKTRRGDAMRPEEHVRRDKQRRLTRLAAALCRRDEFRDRLFRFDVIGIVWPDGGEPTVTHLPGAFDSRL